MIGISRIAHQVLKEGKLTELKLNGPIPSLYLPGDQIEGKISDNEAGRL